MNDQWDYECDALIIGAGMTGSMLARHMHYEMPDLDILHIESKTEFDHTIGESTVEAFEIYARWACKLGPYLEKWYVNKEALRYFFDNEEGTLPIQEMSEFGRTKSHGLRASQLDRKMFDHDMVEMNRKLGIRIMLGTQVLGGRSKANLEKHIRIDREKGHLIETNQGTIKCKWLVDAAGLAAPVSRLHDGFVSDKSLPVCSYWSRFEDCNIIDELGDEEWRARVGSIQRFQSTLHFMYRGYWWWVIPLSDTEFSIGVSWHQEFAPRKLKLKNGEQFEEMIRSYQWGRQLLGDKSVRHGFHGLANLAAYSKQRFSDQRWYLTGMSSCVVDPLNSNVSRIFPENNTYVIELIKSDRAGNTDLHRRQLALFETRMNQIYDGAYEAYRHYNFSGSYDVMVPFLLGNISTYFNMMIPDYMTKFKKIKELAPVYEPDSTDGGSVSTFGKEILGTYARLSQEMCDYVDKTNRYYDHNAGLMHDTAMYEHRPGIHTKFNRRDDAAENEENLVTLEYVVRMHVKRMAEFEKLEFDEEAFQSAFERSFTSEQTIAGLVKRCCMPAKQAGALA